MSLDNANKRASGLNFGSPVIQHITGAINSQVNNKERAQRIGLHDFSSLVPGSDILHEGPPFLDLCVPIDILIDRFHDMVITLNNEFRSSRIDDDVREP